jgi:hypothetical protein
VNEELLTNGDFADWGRLSRAIGDAGYSLDNFKNTLDDSKDAFNQVGASNGPSIGWRKPTRHEYKDSLQEYDDSRVSPYYVFTFRANNFVDMIKDFVERHSDLLEILEIFNWDTNNISRVQVLSRKRGVVTFVFEKMTMNFGTLDEEEYHNHLKNYIQFFREELL